MRILSLEIIMFIIGETSSHSKMEKNFNLRLNLKNFNRVADPPKTGSN